MNDLILSFSLEASCACPSDTWSYLLSPCCSASAHPAGRVKGTGRAQISFLRQLGHLAASRRPRSGWPIAIGLLGDDEEGQPSSHCCSSLSFYKEANWELGIGVGLGGSD